MEAIKHVFWVPAGVVLCFRRDSGGETITEGCFILLDSQLFNQC